jgi:photosynthetic reaction center M subunit
MLPDQPEASRIVVGASEAEYSAYAAADAQVAEVIPLSIVEEFYKKPGGTLIGRLFGADPLDFWLGRFYVGTFGAISMLFAALGTLLYLYAGMVVPRNFNIITARIDPPPLSAGLQLAGPGEQGFYWQLIVAFATIAFLGWALREIDISRKLRMGYQVPITYLAVVSSWVTLQFLRPIAMGAWGNGFQLGITAHLDWVSNIGYQYFNFFYNPFHAIAIALFFGSTMLLAMHGSAILSAINRPNVTVRNIDAYWRGIVGYSIGEIGIHRVAFWVAIAAVLVANTCIFLSGTLVHSWNGFWQFWDRLPIWSFGGAGGMALAGRSGGYDEIDLDAVEAGGRGLEGNFGRPFNVGWFERNLGAGQVGPIYLGVWGVISAVAGGASIFIILITYLIQVGYNPILFLREFAVLAVNPPPASYGLGWAPWNEGGAWLAATFFLHISVLAWWARVYSRARTTGVGANLARAFAAALFLYFIIYLIRPVLLGAWSEAPGHGLKAHLDWTNNVSVRYGNFYYNPFHMISIFFLLGSTMLLGMHGATIVATSPYKSELELKEAEIEGPGTHRAQLFWRWTMGFNANAASIHDWAWWFAIFTVIAGGIGLLLSGTVVHDWYAWAQQAHIVSAPYR